MVISIEDGPGNHADPHHDRKVEDREAQCSLSGLQKYSKAKPWKLRLCAFQELRRRVVPFGRSREQR